MTVSAPPRPPSQAPEAPDNKPLDREEIEALVEALIEEARREQRRRHRRYWALAAVAALVGAVVLILLDGGAASQTAAPAVSARLNAATETGTSMVAFASCRVVSGRSRCSFYVVNADGSGLRNLTHDLGLDGAPVWSHDGRKIAFARDSPDSDGIWMMNADGSGLRRLVRDGALPFAWSPDGQKIAFWRQLDLAGSRAIYVVNADGSGLRRLVRDGWGPAWSPDGRRIAFARERFMKCRRVRSPAPCGSLDLYVVNADGSNPRKLASDSTISPLSPPQFSWSPDGRRIAFVSKRDGNAEIYVMNADGSEQQRLTRTRSALRDRAPVWSPDGRRIAFVRSQFLAFEDIYVMNANGSGQRRLIRNGIGPRWSPDGRLIAFTRAVAADRPFEPWQRDVWVANADGSGERNLSHRPLADDGLVGWSPGQK